MTDRDADFSNTIRLSGACRAFGLLGRRARRPGAAVGSRRPVVFRPSFVVCSS